MSQGSKTRQQLAARMDEALAANVQALAPTGLTQSEIVKRAVALFVEVYQVAVANKVAEPHEIPELTAYRYRLPAKPQPPRTGAIQLPRLNLASAE
ncbi:hypothetical protein [Streptomyces sp. H34-S4]|uniref:hypothetical protein n=1 Tax=Streptomyces sp. H34-S4 TaxID=2996463 RepID=UPI00227077AD|nr:hypothetical protein [Streptomyces sp. H34-S4]MCY0933660.1 hypothetical protein [Streptomyces sp. H34-S4]